MGTVSLESSKQSYQADITDAPHLPPCILLVLPAGCASSCPKTSNNVSVYDPVCVITRVSPRLPGATAASYFNPCIAQCYVSAAAVMAGRHA